MAIRLASLIRKTNYMIPFGCRSIHKEERYIIGNREIVGYGFNGRPSYFERWDCPFPAIRWKELTPELCALREREKGDWRKLTLEEKKEIYRANFRQTFSEMNASSGEWKLFAAVALFCVSLGICGVIFYRVFIYRKEFPVTFNEDHRRALLRRILDLKINPITGISSKWDYERDDWKK